LIDLQKACHFQPGIPVEPMLAKPTKSIQEVLKRLNGQEFTCEFKYDGERAQIHKTSDGTLKVFSRNLLETSNKYPEVPQFVQEAAEAAVNGKSDVNPAESFVLDAEVVAFNRETGQLVPFQVLSTRKKTEQSADTAKVQVIVQAFDLMFLNGQSLLGMTLKERRSLLHKHFVPVEGKFQFAMALDHVEDGDTTVLEQFLDTAVKGQCEGLMVKTMEDVYEPSRRSLNWLKLKKDYLDGLGDSFDLVPIGAYHGRGKRTGVYGAYLLACYDEDSEEYQSVCKIGTGFSDEDLQQLSTSLNMHKLEGGKASSYVVTEALKCDVWFDAVQVWEVKAADLSKSSAHRGAFGKLEEGRGIGLRFPRFERVRDDKGPEQATSSDQVLDLYYNQDTVKGQKNSDFDDDGI
jgi:DNA ligase-1